MSKCLSIWRLSVVIPLFLETVLFTSSFPVFRSHLSCCMERATSIAELNFTGRRIDLQWRYRKADTYYVFWKKSHFSFPTNRYSSTITGRIDKKNLNRDSMTLCRDICSIPDSLMDVFRNFRTWSYRTLSQLVSSFWILTYRRRMIVNYDSFQFGHRAQLNQREWEVLVCAHDSIQYSSRK